MSLVTRTYTFTDGTTAYGSQVDSEVQNLVNTFNNLDAGSLTWDIVKVVNASSVPLIVDNGTGSNDIADFKVNGVTKLAVDSLGGIQATKGCTAALPMNSNKITGLANGTTSTDAAAFGQLHYFQYVQATGGGSTTTTSSTFTATGLTASITPSDASHKVKITVTGEITLNSASTTGQITIKRGSTELSGSANGFQSFRSGSNATGNPRFPVSISFVDTPSATTSTTYTVYVLSTDNTNQVVWAEISVPVMILEEIL